MAPVLGKRLLFVTGKGGVGKSTIAGSIGIAALEAGKTAILVELKAQGRITEYFGVTPSPARRTALRDGLYATSVDAGEVLRDYLSKRAGRLSEVLIRSKTFMQLTEAVPGLNDMLALGKIWQLTQEKTANGDRPRYDVVVVDAPASGHALGLLRTPGTFRAVARVGPLARQAETIECAIRDRSFCGVVGVTTPEEMGVNELIELRTALMRHLGREFDAVIVNGVQVPRFSGDDLAVIEETLKRVRSCGARTALRAALSAQRRSTAQRKELTRLEAAIGRSVIKCPFLSRDVIGPEDLTLVARSLTVADLA